MTLNCIHESPYEPNCADQIVVNENPIGVRDCVNNSFRTFYPFISGKVEVHVDGIKIDPSGYVEHIDSQGFTFLIDENDPKKLNKPISNIETITVNYIKADGLITLLTI